MKTPTTRSGHPVYSTHQATGAPPDSELPAVAPPRQSEELVPNPAADFGGLDTIPEDLLGANQRREDELDYGILETELPGEDQARETGEPSNRPPERWGT